MTVIIVAQSVFKLQLPHLSTLRTTDKLWYPTSHRLFPAILLKILVLEYKVELYIYSFYNIMHDNSNFIWIILKLQVSY